MSAPTEEPAVASEATAAPEGAEATSPGPSIVSPEQTGDENQETYEPPAPGAEVEEASAQPPMFPVRRPDMGVEGLNQLLDDWERLQAENTRIANAERVRTAHLEENLGAARRQIVELQDALEEARVNGMIVRELADKHVPLEERVDLSFVDLAVLLLERHPEYVEQDDPEAWIEHAARVASSQPDNGDLETLASAFMTLKGQG